MSGRFAKGYLRSPAHKIGFGHPVGVLFSATGTLPTRVSHRAAVVEVLDQLGTSSCVAHAVTQQIRTQLVLQGVKAPPLPSRLFTYFAARKSADPAGPLVDAGTYIHAAYEGLAQLGYPPERAWAFSEDPARVNSAPDWEAIREAADQRWLKGHYRIASTGGQRIEDVKAALAAGYTVTWGTQVDQAFEDLKAGQIWPGCGPRPLGGHAKLLVGYEPGDFEECNSWSPGWCDGGFDRCSEDAIASPEADDFCVASLVPNFSGGAS